MAHPMDRLPDDALAAVLRRLPARDLAACRCVRKCWRGVVDAHDLLAALLRPRSLRGVFINYGEYRHPHLLARRTPPAPAGAAPQQVDGTLSFMPDQDRRTVVDHCNGLLLYRDRSRYYVCNPATRRWRRLPPPRRDFAGAYLAFDPAASSLHYEVFLLPCLPEQDKIDKALGFLRCYFDTSLRSWIEWPPAQYKMEVFSSRSGRWEERMFVREGNAVVTLADVAMEKDRPIGVGIGPQQRYAELWKGSLYIHCRGSFLTRLSLSDNKYKVIKTPTMVDKNTGAEVELYARVQPYLGRSEKGVYFVEIQEHQLWIWSLNELHGLMKWELNHHMDLLPLAHRIGTIQYNNKQVNASWELQDYYSSDGETYTDKEDQTNSNDGSDGEDEGENEESEEHTDDLSDGDEEESQDQFDWNNDDDDMEGMENSDYSEEGESKGNKEESQDQFEWNSDDDYSLKIEKAAGHPYPESLDFLGFHPYKEVIFLARGFRAVAYQLGSGKAQYLGSFYPRHLIMLHGTAMLGTFPYTPCFMDALPEEE
ncbi:hypothetical protein ACP4OV_008916 [Aristida adscensionis]